MARFKFGSPWKRRLWDFTYINFGSDNFQAFGAEFETPAIFAILKLETYNTYQLIHEKKLDKIVLQVSFGSGCSISPHPDTEPQNAGGVRVKKYINK